MARVRTGSVLLVWGVLLAAANLRASLTTVGPLLDRVQADTGMSATAAGSISTVPLLAFAVVSPLVPRISGRLGVERAITVALGVVTVGIAIRSLPTIPALFVGTALLGVGIAVGNVLLPTLIKRDFPDRVGLLTSSYVTVMNATAAVASGVAVPISGVAVGGWRTAWGCWLVLAAIATVVWLPRAVRAGSGSAHGAKNVARIRLPWHSPLAWAVTLFMGLQSLGFYVLITWLPAMAHTGGYSRSAAGWLLFVFQAVTVVVNLAMPVLLRRGRDQRLLTVASSGFWLVGDVGLLLLPQQALVWSVVLGIASGSSLVLALTFFGLRAPDAATANALSAMGQSLGYGLAAAGPLVVGALKSATEAWTIPIALLCLVALVQLGTGVFAGRGQVTGRTS